MRNSFRDSKSTEAKGNDHVKLNQCSCKSYPAGASQSGCHSLKAAPARTGWECADACICKRS